MAIRKYKPTTPGRRGSSGSTFDEITRSTPEKSLIRPLHGHGGQTQEGSCALRVAAGGLAIVFFGLVKVTHEKVALAQFLIDFVIQLIAHNILPN